MKQPALQTMQSWSTGGAIPSYMMPDFASLIKQGNDIFGTLTKNVEAAYAPEKAAIDKYYGPAMITPEIETIKKQAATAKEATAGMRGLPSQTGRQMEGIATWQAGAIVETHRVADLAKAGAMVAFENQLGTEKANISKALADFDLKTTEQQTMYAPTLRLNALQGIASNQFMNPEGMYAQSTQGYANLYQQQLSQYQTDQSTQLSWIKTFADLGVQAGAAVATGGASVAAEGAYAGLSSNIDMGGQ